MAIYLTNRYRGLALLVRSYRSQDDNPHIHTIETCETCETCESLRGLAVLGRSCWLQDE